MKRIDGLPAELPAHLAAELSELVDAARDYAEAAQAPNTSRAYASDWKQFTGWCDRYQLQSLPAPAAVVALYLTSLARRGLAVSTIRRRAAAIARAHRQAGHLSATGDPGVLTVLEGISRVHGAAPNKKTALLRDPLLELIDRIDPASTAGVRDRALLLLGLALGLRRSTSAGGPGERASCSNPIRSGLEVVRKGIDVGGPIALEAAAATKARQSTGPAKEGQGSGETWAHGCERAWPTTPRGARRVSLPRTTVW